MDRGAERARAADDLCDLGGRAGRDAKRGQIEIGERLDVLCTDRGFELLRQRICNRAHERLRRPILPGLKMPSGSSACFAASKIAIASRCSPAMYGALRRPTPW